ncbi:hypothetical protein VTL71DRAFT_7814 [Oculimacula yallundae]|uniref:Uncharacterized protein n=1 Tax=Oculimacula yallundae TaxID=86028 RepID=A0ABR4CVS1_9HELO
MRQGICCDCTTLHYLSRPPLFPFPSFPSFPSVVLKLQTQLQTQDTYRTVPFLTYGITRISRPRTLLYTTVLRSYLYCTVLVSAPATATANASYLNIISTYPYCVCFQVPLYYLVCKLYPVRTKGHLYRPFGVVHLQIGTLIHLFIRVGSKSNLSCFVKIYATDSDLLDLTICIPYLRIYVPFDCGAVESINQFPINQLLPTSFGLPTFDLQLRPPTNPQSSRPLRGQKITIANLFVGVPPPTTTISRHAERHAIAACGIPEHH